MTREELLKVAKPILFNTEMVKAILEGRKACTRRVAKPQPTHHYDENCHGANWVDTGGNNWACKSCGGEIAPFTGKSRIKAPYQIGDILYVRETWLKADDGYYYRADETPISKEIRESYGYKWKPSIHMPKELARIFLKVTDVRVERLSDMSVQDMINEGVRASDITTNRGVIGYRVTNRFEELWNSTVKKQDLDQYGWEANPFVWVIEFERVEVE